MTDTSLYYSTDDELDLELDPDTTPVALNARFVFDLPASRTRLAVSDANRTSRRTSSLSKSFKKARRRVESLGTDNGGTRDRLNSTGSKIRNKIRNKTHFKHRRAKPAQEGSEQAIVAHSSKVLYCAAQEQSSKVLYCAAQKQTRKVLYCAAQKQTSKVLYCAAQEQ